MKYQEAFDKLIEMLADPEWGEKERKLLASHLLEECGGETAFDRDIDIGVKNGYSIGQQIKLFRALHSLGVGHPGTKEKP